jgi:hypothetical protein
MASKKGSQLPVASTVADTDSVIIVTATTPTTKRATKAALLAGLATQWALASHTTDTGNPHAVTNTQVGLGAVDNTPDSAKPVSTATQSALAAKADTTALTAHTADIANPHGVTKAQVGLANVLNVDATARANHTGTQTASTISDFSTVVSANADVLGNTAARHTHANKTALDAITASYTAAEASKLAGVAPGATANDTDANLKNRVNHTGTQSADTIVDGTSNKAFTAAEKSKLTAVAPNATANGTDAQQLRDRSTHTGSQLASTISDFSTAADARLTAQKGQNSGLASLDSGGKVPAVQLPSFVDDVLEFANLAAFPATGSSGAIYVTLDTNRTYRWGGSSYVEISPSPGSTDAVPEGAGNFYFTTTRASAAAPVQSVAGKTGTVSLTTTDVAEGTNLYYPAADKTKLSGVAAGATANSTDAQLRDRATHTGTQTAATISDFQTTVSANTTVTASVTHAERTDNPHGVTKGQVGLGSADNTSDINKPVSTVQQTALNLKAKDAVVVHLAGAETVTGAKTFNAGTLLDKGSTVFNVKAFGAIGDGTTNDTAAVTSTISALNAAGGGYCYFPKMVTIF